MKKYNLIIFDMDGTILNTIRDMHNSVNVTMRHFNFPERTLAEVQSFVGNGIHKLIERAVPKDTPAELIEDVFHFYMTYYRAHCADLTRPYEGILPLLDALKERGYLLAVVSNKADAAVKDLSEKYFTGYFDLSVGDREGMDPKPAPDLVLYALNQLNTPADKAIYVGDSDVDVMTAKNSQLPCVSVTWGFRTRQTLLDAGATTLISDPMELLTIL